MPDDNWHGPCTANSLHLRRSIITGDCPQYSNVRGKLYPNLFHQEIVRLAKIFDTSTMTASPGQFGEGLWAYNGLDCCITFELLEAMLPDLTPETAETYLFSRQLQAPILEMNTRGILIDKVRRDEVVKLFQVDAERLEIHLNLILRDGLGLDINWRSNQQLQHLFYDVMGIKPVLKRNNKGEYTPTVDRGALEKLRMHYYALPIINHILSLRDLTKKIEVLQTGIDPDGRIRTSFNIAGTNTGRLSSSNSDFDTGRNLQNIDELLRSVFVGDNGYKFANIDLEQADSRNIGALIWKHLGDSTYLDACEGGDLHTIVCKMAWPTEFNWTGNTKQDKEMCDGKKFYREDSYRQCAKKMGHGTNYYGKPPGMSIITKYPQRIISDFQARYFAAFPLVQYHHWIRQQLLAGSALHNLWGRRRRFFGRRNDEATLREAIAFTGQSSTADFLNHAMMNVWRQNLCNLMIQVHDSFLIQYPEDREDEVLPQIIKAMKCPITINGREFFIPCEAKVGWNWGKQSKENPDGLVKFVGADTRKRQSRPAATSFLDRRLF